MTDEQLSKGIPLLCEECGRVIHQGTAIQCYACKQVFHHLCWENIGEHGLLMSEPCPTKGDNDEG